MLICKSCNKPVIKDVTVWAKFYSVFHSSCSRQHVLSRGANSCCVQTFLRSKSTKPWREGPGDSVVVVGTYTNSNAESVSPNTPLFVFPSADETVYVGELTKISESIAPPMHAENLFPLREPDAATISSSVTNVCGVQNASGDLGSLSPPRPLSTCQQSAPSPQAVTLN